MPRLLKAPLPPLEQSDRLIGATIARLRKERGLSQTQLADIIGIRQTLISDYETGDVRLHAEMIIRFSKALQVSADVILGLDPPTAPQSSLSLKFAQRMHKIAQLPAFDQKSLLKTIDNALKGAGINDEHEAT